MKYYAVKVGRKPGIYSTWDECRDQVEGYSNAQYKKFTDKDQALEFIGQEKTTKEKEGQEETKLGEKTLIAYVDGSFDIEDGSYSYGAVLIDGEDIKEFSKRFPKDQYSDHRNVIGEIRGAAFAMTYGVKNSYNRLILHYDYEGIEKWATGAWKRNKEATKAYYEFFLKIKKDLTVDFVKVKAHTGDRYNEMADHLAKNAKI
ncbi:MAG: ribonuclease H family protein [Bacillota bacterium]|nr:ribonuclease H family protein [Bacillota bacterium]